MSLLSNPTFRPLPEQPPGFPGLRTMAGQPSPRIAVKLKGRIQFINLSDVITARAQRNYVTLYGQESSHLMRESISVLAEILEPYGFVRIHRSILVNSSFVEEIRPLPTGEYGLRIKGGEEYTITRTYKKNLKSLAEFWIGRFAFFSASPPTLTCRKIPSRLLDRPQEQELRALGDLFSGQGLVDASALNVAGFKAPARLNFGAHRGAVFIFPSN